MIQAGWCPCHAYCPHPCSKVSRTVRVRMESASPARYRASLYRAEEGTIMGTISPRVRRSAACTASRIFLRSSSENIFISPAPGGAPAAETSPASAETAAESASARKLAETSSTPAAEFPWRTSAAARHPRQRHRDDQHDDRSDDGQDQAGREGQQDRKSTRLNSSHVRISYAVFCL